MKRYNKYLILILILVSILSITGCKINTFKNSDEDDNITDITSGPSPTGQDASELDSETNPEHGTYGIEVETSNVTNDESSPVVIQPTDNKQLLIYVVNTSGDLEALTALTSADSEITPELVVKTVVDSMADQSLIIGIESVTTKDDAVIVSFKSDKAPLKNVGSGLEESILNAIAQSITDNLDDYHKVIYRVEGGPYQSGHIELGIDEVYHEEP